MGRLWRLERELGQSICQEQGLIFGLLGQRVAGETGRDFALEKRDWGFRTFLSVIAALEFMTVLVVYVVLAALCIMVDVGVMAVLGVIMAVREVTAEL